MNPPMSRTDALAGPPLGAVARRHAWLNERVQWRLLQLVLLVADGVGVALGFTLAYVVRFELSLPVFRLEVVPSPFFYARVVAALIPLWLLLFAVLGLYHRRNLLGGTQEYALVFRGTTLGLLLIVVAGFLDPQFIIARGWVLLAWSFGFFFVAAERFLVRRTVYALRQRGFFVSPAVVVGSNDEARLLIDQLSAWKTSGLHVVGVVDDGLPPGTKLDGGAPVLGDLDQLDTVIDRYDVEEVIIATSALSRDRMLDLFERYGVSEKVNLRLSSGLFEIITTGLHVKELAYVPLVSVNKVRLTGPDRVMKLLLDLGLTIPAIILLAPVFLVIAVLIRLETPGPIIYRRRVMGINGRQFDAYKFRTMYVDGDRLLDARPELKEELQRNYKLKDDPRVTPLSRVLRRFSLDELPQLFNVVKRDMSLVGPRMISPEEMPKYNQWGLNLLTVHPGITGLWQVSGRADIDYEERVRLDMYYIRNWTIWLDLHLLLQTIPAVLRGRGAY